MAPAWQEITSRAAQKSLAVMCPACRSANRLANCFRIGGVVLVALDVRLHVLRRHQPHLVTKRAQLASPVMGRRTRFQPDHTAGNAAEEGQHLPAPQPREQNQRTEWLNTVYLKKNLDTSARTT